MKKAIIISAICVSAIAIIIFAIIVIAKIIWLNNAQKYDADNYPGSTWVCEEPKIIYKVSEDLAEKPSVAETVIGDKTVYFTLGSRNQYIEASEYSDSDWEMEKIRGYSSYSEPLFTGSIWYYKDEFTITINKDRDSLFNGEYSKLFFHRVIDQE